MTKNKSTTSREDMLLTIFIILLVGSFSFAIVDKDNRPVYFEIVDIVVTYSLNSMKSSRKNREFNNPDNPDCLKNIDESDESDKSDNSDSLDDCGNPDNHNVSTKKSLQRKTNRRRRSKI
ncbi:MAG: hypothetical protein ACHBN1_24350 [Heteroscytonema crispum UTEX LB 1556]